MHRTPARIANMMRLLLLIVLCMLRAQPAHAIEDDPVPVVLQEGASTLRISDLTPRFLDFHRAARGRDPDARWQTWKQRYGFAAVPPTPAGDSKARELLDAAWPRYDAALASIERGAAPLHAELMAALREVAAVLDCGMPLTVEVIVYVGAFDGNAFTYARDGVVIVAVPIEMASERRALVLRHEFTHAVHLSTAGLDGGWERSIAQTVLQEGLAMHVAEVLVPGRDVREYTSAAPGWLEAVRQRAPEILRGIEPAFETRDAQTVHRFTAGTGSTGLKREAYAAGWLLVEELARQGMTLPEMARIPEPRMAEALRSAMRTLPPVP